MNTQSFARKSILAASICAAFAATGCVASDGDDFDDEDSDTGEEAVTITAATTIMKIAGAAGSKAAGALGNSTLTKILEGLGLSSSSTELSKASMQEIANLVGTTVRADFLNTYEAKLKSAYTLSGQYSRTCTTKQSCGGTLTTLQSKATDIINFCTEVSEYYKLSSLAKDRLTVAPQLVNALMLNTTFLAETYQLFKLQNPTGNNLQYRKNTCNFAKSSVNTMDALDQQFKDYVNGRVTPIYKSSLPKGFEATCYKLDGKSNCVSNYMDGNNSYSQDVIALKQEREQKHQAMYSAQRPKILGSNFVTIRSQFVKIGGLCN
ncbi:MAG: hypothetical protein ABI134_21815 [Byssovorax sp.]